MPEVYSFLEATIKRVGSTVGGTTETDIDAYAEGITVSVSRELTERKNTSGVVKDRIPTSTRAEMNIKKFYSDDPFLLDGNNIKLYLDTGVGSVTWQMGTCWWESKTMGGDAEGGPISYECNIVGNSWGTV